MSQSPAPILFFAFNRPEHTRLALQSLSRNKEAANSILYIICDFPKQDASVELVEKNERVKKLIREEQWCATVIIIEREKNYGLANNIISGVTEIVNKHGSVIVLEDDLELSPFFLQYMNEALVKYASDDRVISIHGYTYPITEELPETFFLRGTDCWGWATWKRGWELFEPDGKKLMEELKSRKLQEAFNFNHSYDYMKMLRLQIGGKNSSWAVRWHASALLKDKLTLYPGHSLVQNKGADGEGTHMKKSLNYIVPLYMEPIRLSDIPVIHNETVFTLYEKYFRQTHTPFWKYLWRF